MSGSPPAVSEACADEEEGGHTPYQAAAAHQAAPAAHTSYLFCEEPKKSGIMILLHTIRESLGASDGNNNGWFLEPRVSLIWLKGDQSEAVWSSIPPKQHQWHQWRSPFIGRWKPFVPSRFNRREGEMHQPGARMFADFREAKEIDVSPVWSKSLQILCRRSISLIISSWPPIL